MKQRPAGRASSSEKIIRDIRRKTRKQYSAEEKIRIVLDGLRGEDSIAEALRVIPFQKLHPMTRRSSLHHIHDTRHRSLCSRSPSPGKEIDRSGMCANTSSRPYIASILS